MKEKWFQSKSNRKRKTFHEVTKFIGFEKARHFDVKGTFLEVEINLTTQTSYCPIHVFFSASNQPELDIEKMIEKYSKEPSQNWKM